MKQMIGKPLKVRSRASGVVFQITPILAYKSMPFSVEVTSFGDSSPQWLHTERPEIRRMIEISTVHDSVSISGYDLTGDLQREINIRVKEEMGRFLVRKMMKNPFAGM